jgi:poly(hydroxyalkanoate) depolymerase family esterase
MFDNLGPAMRRALAATRGGNPGEATRLIQQLLGTPGAETTENSATQKPPSRRRKSLGETLEALRTGSVLDGRRSRAEPEIAKDAAFLRKIQQTATGTREYRLYVPSSPHPRGLIVMLHGCKQNAEDFAIGTTMNSVAEAEGFLVAYPAQPQTANPSSCWNWFRPEDQMREKGEPHIIAEMTRSIIREYKIDEAKVFVAGLSAGGAMAAVMAATYPDLYEAAGIHSGLAHQSASDVPTAFAAMRGDHRGVRNAGPLPPRPARQIVFHGASDRTVAPHNARVLMDGARSTHGPAEAITRQFQAGSRNVEHIEIKGRDETPKAEVWLIAGAGHHWSGGDPAGSYAKADGPNASKEMMRFFLGQALRM